MTMTVAVAGMTCPTCETSIEVALRRLPEVRSVRADYRSGRVEVTLERPVDEPVVRATIEEAGYELAGTGASSAGR